MLFEQKRQRAPALPVSRLELSNRSDGDWTVQFFSAETCMLASAWRGPMTPPERKRGHCWVLCCSLTPAPRPVAFGQLFGDPAGWPARVVSWGRWLQVSPSNFNQLGSNCIKRPGEEDSGSVGPETGGHQEDRFAKVDFNVKLPTSQVL